MAINDDRLNQDQAVDRFLLNGEIGSADLAELAEACDRRVRSETQISASKSVELGHQFVRQAERHGGPLLHTALRALGWALLVAGRYAEAEKTYLKVRSMMRRDALSRGRIDRVLVDVYMYLGRFKEARRRVRMALATFRRLKADADIAKTKVNYANLLHRQDRHREAKELYQQAAGHFVSEKEELTAALCFYNLANTQVQLFDFEGASQHFKRGRKIFERHGHYLHATGCLYGMSWLHMLQGDFHTALKELSACEEEYQKGQQPRELVLCQLDRAESFLSLNLFIDARKAAEQAAAGATKLGINYEAAKAQFFAAKASLGLGRTRDARAALGQAKRGFRRENNMGFLAAVGFFQAQMDSAKNGRQQKLLLARRLLRKAQLPLWEAICDLQILADWPDEASAAKRLAQNKAVKTVPHLLAKHHTLLGDREALRRRITPAVSHWTKAANILDSVRAKLPPVEMRSAFFGHQSDPYRKLIQTESERDPLKAAVWSEKFKTAGLWSPVDEMLATYPARQKVEQSLSELARQVTAVSAIVDDQSGHRTMTGRSGEVLDCLGRQVRDELASLETLKSPRSESSGHVARQIKACSMTQPIVQFHVGTRDIIAFIHETGLTRTYRYIDGVEVLRNLVARWRFHVECAPALRKRQRSSHLADENNILQRIGNWLLPPLELPSRAGRLLVLPEGQLASLPWAAIPCNGDSLTDRYDLIFAPSLRHHLHARRQAVRSRRVSIFVGESRGLTHIRDEVEAVRSCSPERLTESYDPCRRSDWPNNSSAGIWHFTGHASLRSDNPFYSALMLADGPMFAADFRLRRNHVKLVTLAACRTGQHTSLPGEEATGLVRSLLEMGAQNVVASNWAVSDLSTSHWMDLMYRCYLGGTSAGKAVKHAAQGVREKFPSAYNWGAFSVFGAG